MPSPIRASPQAPSPIQAVALGALHGLAELAPISSSGHLMLVPWLLGWEHDRLDADLRNGFELALHAGTVAGMLVANSHELRRPDRRRLALITAASLPPAIAGLALKQRIEARPAGAATVASGLIAGAVAMLVADRQPEDRHSGEAGAHDALCLGAAQACALVPGVSRSGATLTAARMRRFTRSAAADLSSEVGLPVIIGAAAWEMTRRRGRRLDRPWATAWLGGAGAAFLSTLAAARLRGPAVGDRLDAWAAYRLLAGATILIRLRRHP